MRLRFHFLTASLQRLRQARMSSTIWCPVWRGSLQRFRRTSLTSTRIARRRSRKWSSKSVEISLRGQVRSPLQRQPVLKEDPRESLQTVASKLGAPQPPKRFPTRSLRKRAQAKVLRTRVKGWGSAQARQWGLPNQVSMGLSTIRQPQPLTKALQRWTPAQEAASARFQAWLRLTVELK